MLRTIVPGDPIQTLAGDFATPEMIESLRIKQGLDKPLHIQFFIFVRNALQGDLGNSIFTGLPVTDRVIGAYPVTIRLTIYSFLFSMTLGLMLGVITSYYHDTWLDNIMRIMSVTFASVPTFWLGLMLILIFAVWLDVLPVQGDMLSLEGLLLPAISLGAGSAASLARLVRASMLEVLNTEYVRTARAKGLHEWGVVVKHSLRNALVPIITIAGFQIGGLLGGAIITENIFGLAGMGTLVINGITSRDYPVVQGTVLFTAFTYLGVNIIVDVMYAYVDPRIRYD
ncbi:MAG: ABC transporter permease [Anaerolineales bacterium]|nr:ABC transporter permease [Anaerolineales bacterium]